MRNPRLVQGGRLAIHVAVLLSSGSLTKRASRPRSASASFRRVACGCPAHPRAPKDQALMLHSQEHMEPHFHPARAEVARRRRQRHQPPEDPMKFVRANGVYHSKKRRPALVSYSASRTFNGLNTVLRSILAARQHFVLQSQLTPNSRMTMKSMPCTNDLS